MLVELGTEHPVAPHHDPDNMPVVVYSHIPDTWSFKEDVDTEDWRRHLTDSVMRRNGITHYDGGEALCTLTHPGGVWNEVSRSDPKWVWSDNEQMQRFLSEYYQIPQGRPDDLVDRYWRKVGARLLRPGQDWPTPNAVDMQALLTNVGATLVSVNVGGGQVGTTGTATATTATSLTSGTITSVSANQYAGYRLYTPTAWANIVSHTSGTTPVFTVDQWYSYASPGGSAASTPSTTTTFVIADGGSVSAWFMGLTTTNITPAATDTSLSGEATTNGMGRKIAAYTVTSAASGSSITFTVSTTFTFTGSTATTFYAMGLFNSIVKSDTTDTMTWETSFSGSFTVTNSGDQATVTDTITAS